MVLFPQVYRWRMQASEVGDLSPVTSEIYGGAGTGLLVSSPHSSKHRNHPQSVGLGVGWPTLLQPFGNPSRNLCAQST